jgi:hypothetical protein
MAELKTKVNESSVTDFLDGIADEGRRKDCYTLLQLMENVTGEPPRMWGDAMVGFGSYHYKYKSGHEGDAFLTGFSPRKQNLTVYIMAGFSQYDNLISKLGKCKTSKACLYINKLDDIRLEVLQELVKRSVAYMSTLY